MIDPTTQLFLKHVDAVNLKLCVERRKRKHYPARKVFTIIFSFRHLHFSNTKLPSILLSNKSPHHGFVQFSWYI